MTVIKGFLRTLVVSALLLGGFAYWLLGSNSGLRWATDLAPNSLQVESIDGDLGDFSFSKLQVNFDGITIRIERGSLQWHPFALLSRRASLESLSFIGMDVELAELEQTTTPYTPWQGLELPIDVAVDSAAINAISITRVGPDLTTKLPLMLLSKVEFSGDIENSVLDLKELKIADKDKLVSVQGKVDLSASANGVVDLSHTVNWELEQTKIDSSGVLNGTWSSITIEQNQIAPVNAHLSAIVDNLLGEQIEWSAELVTAARDSQNVMGNTLLLGRGEFKLSGDFIPAQGLAGLTAHIVGQTSIASADYSQWNLDADLTLVSDQLTISTLSLAQKGQKSPAALSIEGQVSHVTSFLKQAGTSVAELGIVDVNGVWSSLSWPLTSSSESPTGQVTSDGRLSVTGSSQRYTVLASATGKAYEQNLKADINMALVGKAVELETLAISSGQSRLSAKGRIGDLLDLSWSIASPDIGDFLANASGPLASTGTVTGQPAKPSISIKANSKGLSYSSYSIGDLDLSAVGSLAATDDGLDISLQASSIRQQQIEIADRLAISIAGHAQSHSILIESTLANNATLKIKANGSLSNDEWRGVLTTLDLNDPVLALWALKNEVAIKVAADILSVSQSCLINQAQAFCFEANKNAQSTKIIAALTALDLANLNRFTHLYDLNIEGQANAEVSYQTTATQTSATIKAYLESMSPVITWQESGDHELSDETLVFESIRASIEQLDDLQASIDVTLANADRASFDLDVDAAVESPAFMQAQVSGQAKLAIADLSVLPTVLLNAVSLNGALNADLELKGSLFAPEIVASGELKDARADIPELGLQLEDLELKVVSDGTSKVDLRGQLRSGRGELLLSGNVDFLNLQAPKLTLVLEGEDLQLADTPELNIVGDIDLTASLENQLLELRGGVALDRSELDFKVPETAVLVSGDVVLIGVEEQLSIFKQRLNITVDLGTKTSIRAQGLEANLSGKLLVFQEPEGVLRGRGEITVNEGRYRAYGQDLKIDKGRLLFDGGSIDDPSLDLKAEKTVDSITAGVSIIGRASAPRLNLYSTPSMQDEDILSVLVFDKPLGKLGSQDGFTLLRIANSLRGDGSSQITKMTEKLQQSLGLTSLELQLTSNAPSLVAGKQLSSKFYVGYGYGLLDAAQSLILRYNLSEAWSIKADLGTDSGADLRYQIER